MIDKDNIMNVLSEAGKKGLKFPLIVRNVYNKNVSLFEDANNIVEIRKEVLRFLLQNSISSTSPIERMEKRGYYRINPNSDKNIQLQFDFSGETEEKVEREYAAEESYAEQMVLFADEDFEEYSSSDDNDK